MKHVMLCIFLIVGPFISSAQINLMNIEVIDVITKRSTSIVANKTNSNGVVIVFMSNECPFSVYYINRLSSIKNQYKDKGVDVVYVNSFMMKDESIVEMEVFGTKHHFGTYLADKNQLLKKQLGAHKTPEVFLLKNSGGKFTQFYKGPIDNNAQVEDDVKSHYLRDNIENLLSNKPATKSGTPVMGCVIK